MLCELRMLHSLGAERSLGALSLLRSDSLPWDPLLRLPVITETERGW